MSGVPPAKDPLVLKREKSRSPVRSLVASSLAPNDSGEDGFQISSGDGLSFAADFAQRSALSATISEVACRECEEPKVGGSSYCDRHKRAVQNLYKSAHKKKDGKYVSPEQQKAYIDVFGSGKGKAPDPARASAVIANYLQNYPDRNHTSKASRARGTLDLTQFVHSSGSAQRNQRVAANKLWDLEMFQSQMKNMRGWSFEKSRQIFHELSANNNLEKDKGGWKGAPRVEIPSELLGEDGKTTIKEKFEQKSLEHSSKLKRNLAESQLAEYETEMGTGFSTSLGLSCVSDGQFFTPLLASAITQRPGAGVTVGDMDEVWGVQTPSGAIGISTADRESADAGSRKGADALAVSQQDTLVSASGPVVPGTDLERSSSKKPRKDMALLRLKAVARMRKESQVVNDYLDSAMKLCKFTVDTADDKQDATYIDILMQRLDVAIHYLGAKPSPTGKSARIEDVGVVDVTYLPWENEQEFTAQRFAETIVGHIVPTQDGIAQLWSQLLVSGVESQTVDEKVVLKLSTTKVLEVCAGLNAARVDKAAPPLYESDISKVTQNGHFTKAVAKFKHLPMESAELPSCAQVNDKISGIGDCEVEEQIEETCKEIHGLQTLVKQLTVSLKTAAKDLQVVVSTRNNDQKKAVERQKQKDLEDKKVQLCDTEFSEKKRLAKVSKMEPFKLDFQEFEKIREVDKQVVNKFTEPERVAFMSKPALIKDTEFAEALMPTGSLKDSTIVQTLGRWLQQFPRTKECKDVNLVHATLPPKLGSSDVQKFADVVLPQAALVRSALPSFANAVETPTLYGHNTFLISSDFESDLLAACRFQVAGETQLVLMPSSAIISFLGAQCKHGNQVREFLTSLTLATLQQLKLKGVPLCYGVAKPGTWVMIPAGWVVGQTTQGMADVYGIRWSFLAKDKVLCKAADTELKALSSLPGVSAEWRDLLLTLLGAELLA